MLVFEHSDPDFDKDMKEDTESLESNECPVIFDSNTTDRLTMSNFVATKIVIERLSPGQGNIDQLRDQTGINKNKDY